MRPVVRASQVIVWPAGQFTRASVDVLRGCCGLLLQAVTKSSKAMTGAMAGRNPIVNCMAFLSQQGLAESIPAEWPDRSGELRRDGRGDGFMCVVQGIRAGIRIR